MWISYGCDDHIELLYDHSIWLSKSSIYQMYHLKLLFFEDRYYSVATSPLFNIIQNACRK